MDPSHNGGAATLGGSDSNALSPDTRFQFLSALPSLSGQACTVAHRLDFELAALAETPSADDPCVMKGVQPNFLEHRRRTAFTDGRVNGCENQRAEVED